MQRPIDGWLDAVAKLPPNTPVLSVDDIHVLKDAKATNPNVKTVFRKWWSDKQGYAGFSSNLEGAKEAAREYFDSFIDGTWEQQELWRYVDYVKEWNEYIATSQGESERQDIIAWLTAVNTVWNEEYRNTPKVGGRDIPLICCSVAIGNDIDPRYAKIVYEYDNVMSYHNYTHFQDGTRDPLDWQYHSGRWTQLDEMFKNTGIYLKWLSTEGGPYYGVTEGWKHSQVLNGDMERYRNECLKYQIDKCSEWNMNNGNRFLGGVLFTSGGSSEWRDYELDGYAMDRIADLVSEYSPDFGNPDPTEPPIVIPPEPNEEIKHNVTMGQLNQIDKEAVIRFRKFEDGKFVHTMDALKIQLTDETTNISITTTGYKVNDSGELTINNIVDELTKHSTKTYATRDVQDIDTIVIHHTVSPPDRTIDSIAQYHVNSNDWPGIGYHYVINGIGEIFQTNHLNTVSYHVGDHNDDTIGIALQGDFTDNPPTDEQLKSTKQLIIHLRGLLTGTDVKPHRELTATQCPGNTVDQWFDSLL